MRRLFSTFATGVPGVGLLVMRLAASGAVGSKALGGLTVELPFADAALIVFRIGLATLLLLGLWTPIDGALVAIVELFLLFRDWSDLSTHILLASLGLALALLGPGAWSIDAWLFGWRRIDIPTRHNRSDTTSSRKQ